MAPSKQALPRRKSGGLKRLLWGIALVMLTLGGAWYALNDYVKGDGIRQLVTQKIEAATGRKVTIAEPLGLTFSLNPAVRVRGVTVANAPWGSDPVMVQADEVLLRVALVPLLSKQLVVEQFELQKPRILLETNRQGQGNWVLTPAEAKPGPTGQAPAVGEPKAGLHLSVQSVVVNGGEVIWHDMGTKTRKTVTISRLTLQPDGKGGIATLQGTYQAVPYDVTAKVADLAPLLARQGEVPLDITAKLADSTVTAKGMAALAAEGKTPLQNVQMEIRGDLPTFAALQPFVAKDKPLPATGPVKLRVAVSGNMDRLTLSPLQVQLLDSELAGTMTVVPPRENRGLSADGTLNLKTPSLARLGAAFGQELANQPADVATRVQFANETLTLTDLDVTSGQSKLAGSAKVVLPAKGAKFPRNVTANLTAPVLRLADFKPAASPAPAATGETAPAGDKGPLFSREPLPLANLRGLNLDINAKIAQLVLPGKDGKPDTVLRDINAVVRGDGRTIRLDNARLALPGGGQVALTADLGVASTPATLDYRLTADRFELGTLLKERGLSDSITGGPARFVSTGKTSGASVHDLAANLNGETSLVVRQATLKSGVTDFLSGPLVQGLLPSLTEGGKASQLNCVVTRWPTRQGVAVTDLTLADTGQLTLAGSGEVNLANETVNLVLAPQAKQPNLANIIAPVRVQGPLGKPEFSVDKTATGKDILNRVVTGQITTGKPLEVLGQIFGASEGAAAARQRDACAEVLDAEGNIRATPVAAVRDEPSPTPTQDAAPEKPSLEQGIQKEIDKAVPKELQEGIKGLFGR